MAFLTNTARKKFPPWIYGSVRQAFPNAAFKFKVGLFHFTWASQKKLRIQSIKFLICTGPSQMQRLNLRLASFTLLGPPKKIEDSEH